MSATIAIASVVTHWGKPVGACECCSSSPPAQTNHELMLAYARANRECPLHWRRPRFGCAYCIEAAGTLYECPCCGRPSELDDVPCRVCAGKSGGDER